MTVYVDGTGHMIADSYEELHEFAIERLGLRREWFQETKYPHYDLTTANILMKAIRLGAQLVSPRDIVKVAREVRERTREEKEREVREVREIFTSNIGDDIDGDGSKDSPFLTFERALRESGDGDIVVRMEVSETRSTIRIHDCGCITAEAEDMTYIAVECEEYKRLTEVSQLAVQAAVQSGDPEDSNAAVIEIRKAEEHVGRGNNDE